MRIAVSPSFPGFPVAGDIAAAVEALAKQLQAAGATVEPAKLPKLDLHDDLEQGGALIGMMLEAAQPEPPENPTPVSRWFEALARRDLSILAWDRFFEHCDALLCPVAMTTAFPHCEPGTPIDVDGRSKAIGCCGLWRGLQLFRPSGADDSLRARRDGLPIGLQLVGGAVRGTAAWDRQGDRTAYRRLSSSVGLLSKPL